MPSNRSKALLVCGPGMGRVVIAVPLHLKNTLRRKEYSLYTVSVSYGRVTLRKPYDYIS